MRILVTRPEDDAGPLMAALQAQGHQPLLGPLLTIRPLPDAKIDLAGVQAILITSANGLRVLADLTTGRDLPIFAVGDASARAAREAGFAQVESAAGDVDDLADLVRRRLPTDGGGLLHPAGTKVAGDLAALLAGYDYRRAVVYEAVTATELPPDVASALKAGQLDGVLFFSPRTAETFVTVVGRAGLEAAASRLFAFCLSQAVADRLKSLSLAGLAIAERPEQAALLDLTAAQKT